jgi:hypothetical protein
MSVSVTKACTACRMAERFCLSHGSNLFVLSLNALENLSRRSARSSAMKNRGQRVFNSKLNFLNSLISSQKSTNARAASSPAVTPAALMRH